MIDNKKLVAAFESLNTETKDVFVAALETYSGMNLQTVVKDRYYTRKEIEAGQGYFCGVDAKCKKLTRSYQRSLSHATTNAELKDFGHIAVR